MLAVPGIFDGEKVEMTEPLPFKTKQKVIVTFLDDRTNETDSDIDPIRLLRGCSKNSSLTEKLLKARKDDLKLEKSAWMK